MDDGPVWNENIIERIGNNKNNSNKKFSKTILNVTKIQKQKMLAFFINLTFLANLLKKYKILLLYGVMSFHPCNVTLCDYIHNRSGSYRK